MKLGILSDTHAAAAITRRAVALLVAAGVEHLVHCGDVGDEAVLDALAGVPASFVFGNNDYDHAGLRRYAETLGITCMGVSGLLEFDGKRVAVTHGDDAGLVARYRRLGSGYDYLLTGHSHVRHDHRSGDLRWINPGALYRATIKTVATLDLTSDTLTTIAVPAA